MTPCNAPHPTEEVRCRLTRGHRGDHGAGDARWPRANRAAEATATASGVLTDLAAGLSQLEVARRHQLTRQHVGRIAAAGGLADRGSTAARATAALVRAVREAAAAADLTPDDYLDEARTAIAACDRIVELLAAGHAAGDLSPREAEIWRLVTAGDAEVAAAVRRVVDAAADD